MNQTIGFYGAGNMGQAIIKGLLQSGIYQASDIWVYDVYQPLVEKLEKELHVNGAKTEQELAKKSETIIFAVKPNVLPDLLVNLSKYLSTNQLLLSIAAGVGIEKIESSLSPNHKIVRIMPNTPALVGEGMSAITYNSMITDEEKDLVLSIFNSFGKAEVVSEKLMDAVVGVSGSAPAYVYMFIEALADGAVLEGMPRQQAYEFAAQTVLGSAKMVLETGKHPGELKDMVTSPGGTTIKAVKTLEEKGFRSAVIDAVQSASQKNKEL